ncbi:MAG TPA: substrate-binding domain-containing protein [Ignavibacteriaceae bacterium]|nr:substrate-binding domain-containing protein [Ignavibacteriaceae bacterium]
MKKNSIISSFLPGKVLFLFFTALLFLLISGCKSEYSDTPTYGSLSISVDETFQPLMDSEVKTFEGIYKYADVEVHYKPEGQAFNDIMNDTIKLIVAARNLNREEIEQFKKWEIVPRVTKIAYDAVALIGSKQLKDSTITLDEIKQLLLGSPKNPYGKNVKVVFDNNNSSTINFLKQKTGVDSLSKNCYALDSSTAVINYVSKEKNTIGVIGVNWISDRDDTTNLNFLKTVKVLEVALTDTSEYYKPYQAYIAQKSYPLWREVYIISKEAYAGLGTGLTAFIASEKGQRIVLKFGLVPATMPVRLVEVINEDINY